MILLNEWDKDLCPKPFLPILNKKYLSKFCDIQIPPISQQKSKYNSKFSALGLNTKKFFESPNLILNFVESENKKK